jgi:hypothetical protein
MKAKYLFRHKPSSHLPFEKPLSALLNTIDTFDDELLRVRELAKRHFDNEDILVTAKATSFRLRRFSHA